MYAIGVARYGQTQAGTVEKPPCCIEPRGTHGIIESVNLVMQYQRLGGITGDEPSAFIVLLHDQAVASLYSGQLQQVFRELAHQVAAWDPHRQANALLCCGLGDGERDREAVPMQVSDRNAVTDSWAR